MRAHSSALAFERGAARARTLAVTSLSAAEPLRFAAALLDAQADVARTLEGAQAALPFAGDLPRDFGRLHAAIVRVAEDAAQHAPAPLAEQARARASERKQTAYSRLWLHWGGQRTLNFDYLTRAMLRPYFEVLRTHEIVPRRAKAPGRCPFCAGAPAVGCRRGASDAQGALRSLVCASCGLEWSVARVCCPVCAEGDPHKLPSFTSAAHPLVRIEACETCRSYVKSLDLSLDARPIPEVDELLSLALDLWAVEQGFTRLEPGLAGL